MGWKEFAASVIESVAWPLVVLVIVLLVLGNFRMQIRSLIARMTSVKGAGVEATFSQELNAVREAVEALDKDAKSPDTTNMSSNEDPLAVIVRAWIELESTVEQLYLGVTEGERGGGKSTQMRLKRLLDDEVISPAVSYTISRLLDLRNKVVHGRHFPTIEEAQSFADSAYDMVDYLVSMNQRYLGDKPLLVIRAKA